MSSYLGADQVKWAAVIQLFSLFALLQVSESSNKVTVFIKHGQFRAPFTINKQETVKNALERFVKLQPPSMKMEEYDYQLYHGKTMLDKRKQFEFYQPLKEANASTTLTLELKKHSNKLSCLSGLFTDYAIPFVIVQTMMIVMFEFITFRRAENKRDKQMAQLEPIEEAIAELTHLVKKNEPQQTMRHINWFFLSVQCILAVAIAGLVVFIGYAALNLYLYGDIWGSYRKAKKRKKKKKKKAVLPRNIDAPTTSPPTASS